MIRSLPSSLFGPIRHGVLKPFADDAKFDHVVWIVGSQSAAENSDNYNDLKSRGDFCTLPKLQLQKCKLRQISILELFVSLDVRTLRWTGGAPVPALLASGSKST